MTPDVERVAAFGSMHFALDVETPFELSGADYVAKLEGVLGGLPNVSAVDVNFPRRFRESRWKLPHEPPSLRELGGPFPFSQFGSVDFVLTPPRESMKMIGRPELKEFEEQPLHVRIAYGFSMPVALVEPIRHFIPRSPSSAVIVVRELLRHHLSEKRPGLKLEILGPSPAHLDVFLKGEDATTAEDPDWTFELRGRAVAGYDQLEITYNRTLVPASEAGTALLHAIQTELDLFYRARQMEEHRRSQWSDLNAAVQLLASWNGASGWRNRWSRLRWQSRTLTRATILLAELQANSLLMKVELDDGARSVYRAGTTTLLKESVMAEVNGRAEYPVDAVLPLLDRLEQRRLTSQTLVAGFGGAVVGAVAALVAGG